MIVDLIVKYEQKLKKYIFAHSIKNIQAHKVGLTLIFNTNYINIMNILNNCFIWRMKGSREVAFLIISGKSFQSLTAVTAN